MPLYCGDVNEEMKNRKQSRDGEGGDPQQWDKNSGTSSSREDNGRRVALVAKGRRRRDDHHHHCDDDDDSPAAKRKAPSSCSLLRGKVFAVSTLVEAACLSKKQEEEQEASSPSLSTSTSSLSSYRQIVALCQDLGAETSGQVHRRVWAVIATQSAITRGGGTQRVRKAWKKGIAVVSPDWLEQCAQQGQVLDMGPYLQQQQHQQQQRPPSPETKPKKKRQKTECNNNNNNNDDAKVKHPNDQEEVTIDLGCCCVCHETEIGMTDCAWCVDCTVNRELKNKCNNICK